LPRYGVVNGFAAYFIPRQNGFALVGYPRADNRALINPRIADYLPDSLQQVFINLGGVMLYPAVRQDDLVMRDVAAAYDSAAAEKDGFGGGCALVDSEDVIHRITPPSDTPSLLRRSRRTTPA
jgi:hypothetical protein